MLCFSGAWTLVSLWYQGFGEVGFLRECTRHVLNHCPQSILFLKILLKIILNHCPRSILFLKILLGIINCHEVFSFSKFICLHLISQLYQTCMFSWKQQQTDQVAVTFICNYFFGCSATLSFKYIRHYSWYTGVNIPGRYVICDTKITHSLFSSTWYI